VTVKAIDKVCQLAHDPYMSSPTTMNIALTDTLRAWVAQRVDSGAYGNASEYVRDLIRKDQEAQRRQTLRALLEAGLASGPAEAFTAADWDELDTVASGEKA
jgi:antitoxin ParD1/3/4